MKYVFILVLTTCNGIVWAQSDLLELPIPKRFIDKIEVFAGLNLSLNYGNMFIENYRGVYANNNYVVNKRLLKSGYSFGVGAHHSFANSIALNVSVQFEQKGTRNELSCPKNPVNDDARQITMDNYSYNYFTIAILPTVLLDTKKKWSISIGPYLSKIKNVRGYSEIYDTRDFQVDKGSFDGRYFYHLRDDGVMAGFSWKPLLTGIEDYDWGLATSIGYRIHINQKHSILVQVQDNLGLKNINKNNTYGLEEKNHALSLIISYTYHLPPKSFRL